MSRKSIRHTKDPLKNEVVLLGEKDLKGCVELDKLVLKGFWSEQQWKDELSSPFTVCLGIINELQLIAFVSGWIIINKIEITVLGVHPDFRRQSHGRRILETLLKTAIEYNVETALIEVRSDNLPAISLYQSLLFRKVSIRRKYYKDNSSALVLERSLSEKSIID